MTSTHRSCLALALILAACETEVPPDVDDGALPPTPVDARVTDPDASPTSPEDAASSSTDGASDAGVTDASIEASADASGDATVDAAGEAPDGGPPRVTPCMDAVCCLPLVDQDIEPSSTCPKTACFTQGETHFFGGDSETRTNDGCSDSSPEYSRISSYHPSSNGNGIDLYAPVPACQLRDAAALRAGIWQVRAAHNVWDPRNFEFVAATLDGPASVIQELTIANGQMHVVIEGAITRATKLGAIGPQCPYGACNCWYAGAGPKAKFITDMRISN